METAAITAVIATYNRCGMLARAIRSIQSQTYPNLEILVCDNASTDDTERVVRELAAADPRIRYHRQATNVGAVRNYVYGMRQVATPLFYLLSDDDVALPHLFESAVAWLDRFPNARFAAGGTLELTTDGEFLVAPQAYWPRDGYYAPPEGLRLMLGAYHPSAPSTIFRREVLDEAGLNPDLPNVCDFDFLMRIACKYPYVVFREPSGIFVRHAESSGQLATSSVIDQFETMIEGLASMDGLDAETRRLVRDKLHEQLLVRILRIALKQVNRDEPEDALRTLRAYHEKHPRTPSTAIATAVATCTAAYHPLAHVLRTGEALAHRVRAGLSRLAARQNAVARVDSREYAAYLK